MGKDCIAEFEEALICTTPLNVVHVVSDATKMIVFAQSLMPHFDPLVSAKSPHL